MLKDILNKLSGDSLGPDDDDIYSVVADEVQRNEIDKGVWAKAISETDGDVTRAKSRYIKLRKNKIKKEIFSALAEEQKVQKNMRHRLSELYQNRNLIKDKVNYEILHNKKDSSILHSLKKDECEAKDTVDNFFNLESTITKKKIASSIIVMASVIILASAFLFPVVPSSMKVWSLFSIVAFTLLFLYLVSERYGVIGRASCRRRLESIRIRISATEERFDSGLKKIEDMNHNLNAIDKEIQKINIYLSKE